MRSSHSTIARWMDAMPPAFISVSEDRDYWFTLHRHRIAISVIKRLTKIAGRRRVAGTVTPMLASLVVLYEAKAWPRDAGAGVGHPDMGVSEHFRQFVAEKLPDEPHHPLRGLIEAAFAAQAARNLGNASEPDVVRPIGGPIE